MVKKNRFGQKFVLLPNIIGNMRVKEYILILVLSLLGVITTSFCYAAKEKRFTVVIDAGHGGHDPGAIGSNSQEKNINLKIALKVGKLIENNCKNVKVIFTRKKDIFVPLDERARIANNAKADLFISIHTNSLPKGKIAKGAETYTLGMARAKENLDVAKKENSVILVEKNYKERYAGFNPNSAESYVIFEFMQDKYMAQSVSLAKLMQIQFKNTAGRIDKGVHQAGFLVLRQTSMPSILIELGYISTPEEENYLNSDNGLDSMSKSIYKAFIKYKDEQTGTKSIVPSDESEEQQENKSDSVIKEIIPAPSIHEEVADTPIINSKNKKTQSQIIKKEITSDKIQIEKKNTTTKEAVDTQKPIFKIQILISRKKLNKKDPRLKGETDFDFYIENDIYKYTIGYTNNYNEILKIKKSICVKFKDAFIVAFKDKDKMNIHEAIQEFIKNR